MGYKRDYVNLGCDVDFEGPIIHATAVLGYEGWLAGYQMAFDTAKSKLAQNNFALGHRTGDFQLHTNVWVLMRFYTSHTTSHLPQLWKQLYALKRLEWANQFFGGFFSWKYGRKAFFNELLIWNFKIPIFER